MMMISFAMCGGGGGGGLEIRPHEQGA